MFFQKAVLKYCAKFTGKPVLQSLFDKVEDLKGVLSRLKPFKNDKKMLFYFNLEALFVQKCRKTT